MNTPLCRRSTDLAAECVDREVQAGPEVRVVLRRVRLALTMHPIRNLPREQRAAREVPVDLEALARRLNL